MAGPAPKSTAATKDITDDDQCSWGCGRFSEACGSLRGEPDRDSGVEGGRGSRLGPIRDVLALGDLFPPFGMAADCRGGSWDIVVFAWWHASENRITGVFPISWVRNRIFGDCMVSLPLAVYGGICADDPDSYFGLLKAGANWRTGSG